MDEGKFIFKGKTIEVYQEHVKLPNGNTALLDIVKHPGASAIVPIHDDGRFVLIRQYRHAVGGYLYEIPAGKLDIKGEVPLDCAKRELLEETGFTARKWSPLVSINTTPGFSNEIIHIFLAQGLELLKTSHEADEVIEVYEFSREEIEQMLFKGDIQDAKSLAGIYTALHKADFSKVMPVGL